MNKQFVIHVRGKQHNWSFVFLGDPKHIDDWRADGLKVFEVVNSIPEWAVNLGLTHIWCRMQDVFNFKNPWSKE